ncbi:MAG: metal-sensing transcriptional repressor [Turicibacter sp.]|nr:metal-sensing transcriptional repressor [Turicibacter sp.]
MNEEKKKATQSLKTARGQIDGIIKMIEEGRYCMDVSNQIAAVSALVRKSQVLILKQHIEHCVTEAVMGDNREEKMDEVMKVLEKVLK